MNNYYSYESFDNAVSNATGGNCNSKLDEPIVTTPPPATTITPPPATITPPSATTTPPPAPTTTPPPLPSANATKPLPNAEVITIPTPTTVFHSISCVQKKLTDFAKLNKATKIADTDMKNMMDNCPTNENDKPPTSTETKELTGICKLSPYVKGFVKKLTDVTTSANMNYVVLAVVVIVLIIYGLLGNNAENDVQTKPSTDL